VSKYKNELGKLNSDRLLEIHNFATTEHKKGNYELYQLVSDFAEQQSEGKEKEISELKAENERLKGLMRKAWKYGGYDCECETCQTIWQQFKTENGL